MAGKHFNKKNEGHVMITSDYLMARIKAMPANGTIELNTLNNTLIVISKIRGNSRKITTYPSYSQAFEQIVCVSNKRTKTPTIDTIVFTCHGNKHMALRLDNIAYYAEIVN